MTEGIIICQCLIMFLKAFRLLLNKSVVLKFVDWPLVWEVILVILVWEVVLRQPPSVVAALDQSEATKSRKQGNLLQGAPHHTIGPDTTLQ